MATILEFRASQDEGVGSKSKAQMRRRSAEIVIFPGVRYERWTAETASAEQKGQVVRDTLTIAD